MANIIQLKRKTTTGAPSLGDLAVGEVCLNTVDETLYWKKDGSTIIGPIGVAGGGDMTKAVFDPNTVNGDAFDMDNMVEGAATKIMTSTERTRLAAMESSADVTDATNVTAAGALMDSEVASLAAIKDVTLSQGLTISASYETADETKLDGIEALADVTDATNVDAAGATMNTDSDVSATTWVLDEDTFSSDSNTKVPTQQSTKAYVDNAISSLVGGAPGALDTLNELAAALADDASYSATVTAALAAKYDTDSTIDGGTIT